MPGIRYRAVCLIRSRERSHLPERSEREGLHRKRPDAIRQRNAAKRGEGRRTKFNEFVDRLGRFSDYLGEEFVVAGVPERRKMTAVAIATCIGRDCGSSSKPRRRSRRSKDAGTKERNRSTARQPEEMLVSIRDDRVVFGVDDAAVNGAFAGGTRIRRNTIRTADLSGIPGRYRHPARNRSASVLQLQDQRRTRQQTHRAPVPTVSAI